jgi:hypothetical protein
MPKAAAKKTEKKQAKAKEPKAKKEKDPNVWLYFLIFNCELPRLQKDLKLHISCI